MTSGRLPYAPLERLLQLASGAPRARAGGQDNGQDGMFCDDYAARVLGVTRWTILKWRKHGLTARQADRAAIAAGYHPLLVWRKAWTCAEIGTDLRRKEKAA